MTGLSEDQQAAALLQLRDALDGALTPHHDDASLQRWLRARNYDVAKAEKMFRSTLTWRARIGADLLVESYRPPEVLIKYYPVGFAGFDRLGCPVCIIPFGNCDIKGLLHSVKKSEYIKYTVYILEKSVQQMEVQTRKLGRIVDQQVVIFDLENFGMKHITWKPAMEVLLQLVQIHEANYPEMLKRAYVVNTPKVFSIAYAMIRPFIDDITASKIKIFGRDKWREAVLELIDASELPAHWGGTRTDETGDPRCPDIICLGGDVPQSYYMAPANRLTESENLKLATVGKKSTLCLEFDISVPGSLLRWEFKSDNYDIGFGISRKMETGLQEVVPMQRVNSHLVPEDGHFVCPEPGTYMVCFDNTFSMFRNKKIAYMISVLPPDGNETMAAETPSANGIKQWQ